MESESVYTLNRNMREIEEGQIARQCEGVSQEPSPTLLEQEQEQRRTREAMVKEKQAELAGLEQQYKVSFSVLKDGQASENAQQAAFILCDEIREERKTVQAELDVLLASARQLDVEASLIIPQDVYEDKSPKKPPFYFGKGK